MPLDTQRIQALCFDVDGTLSDTDDQFTKKLADLLHPVRFLLPGRDAQRAARRLVMWSETPGNILLGIPDSLGIDDELAAIIEWTNRHRPRPKKHFLLIPRVKEMLTQLRGRYKMAVVSARDEESTRIFLEQFDLLPLFDVIVTALTAEHTKPYPDPILYAAKEMGVAPEACLMIGDTTVDIRAGKAAGAQTVGVLCGFGEEKELRRAGADLILESTHQLAETLPAQ
ncbi:MAG: HAD family hydrolase [Chloroflexi bacterium]|nr:HAD family hydrolase [Chloroflexota bacterium]